MQAEIIVSNLVQLMKERPAKDKYVPHFFENTLNLTLGKVSPVIQSCVRHSIDVVPGPSCYVDAERRL